MPSVAFDPNRHLAPPEQSNGHLFERLLLWCDQCGQGLRDAHIPCDPTLSPITLRAPQRAAFQRLVEEVAARLRSAT